MAKANVILLNSILWNLREVTKLAEKVKKHCGDVECTSWRYPLTSCSELEIFKLLQNNKNLDNYTFILELTYDRLLYLFNLIVKYLESKDSLEKFRPEKNVSRPKTLSLASVLHMLWTRIQEMNRTVPTEKSQGNESGNAICLEELNVLRSSTCTQSEVCSISVCSCCEMVQRFVTQLILEMEKVFEKQDFCSALSTERKIMKEYLVEMTSWSAMSRWLAAIIKDFTTLCDKVEQISTNSRKLRHRLESGDRKMKFRLEQHEQEIRKLQEALKDHELKTLETKQKIKELTEDRNELQKKNSELVSSSSNQVNEIQQLKKQLREKRENKLKKDKEREEELKKLSNESKKLEKLEDQNKKLEQTIWRLREDFELLTEKTTQDQNSFKDKVEDLEREIKFLKQENSSLNLVLEDKEKAIKDYANRLMEAFPELNGVPKAKYEASGNPVVDMENQIQANKLRIKVLQSENEKFQQTLDKIKSLKE